MRCKPAEVSYAQKRSAYWLLNLLKSGIQLDASLFKLFEWSTGSLKKVVRAIGKGGVEARDLEKYMKRDISAAADSLLEFVAESPAAWEAVFKLMEQECRLLRKAHETDKAVYNRARKRLEQTFGLNKEAVDLCEFAFLRQVFRPVEDYFERARDVFEFEHRRILSHSLGIALPVLQGCIFDLMSCGILEKNHSTCLMEELNSFWDVSLAPTPESVFCHPLSGKTLPLENFNISSNALSYVKNLLESDDAEPLHILLYGSPGTGKTTFVNSLAHALKLKAWSVPCNASEKRGKGRAELRACLNTASRHKGAFVLFDEADRFLDTGDCLSRATIDKAWINRFLEEAGRRVVWIVNDIQRIDRSIRRRFTYSIHFKDPDECQKKKLWENVLSRHRMKGCATVRDIERFSSCYDVSIAAIESAVNQAKKYSSGKNDFLETLESILDSFQELNSGEVKRCTSFTRDGKYTTKGISLEISVEGLLDKCRRIDAMLRDKKNVFPGGATMLFYGPPGTGKSALARYLSRKLNRELVVKRASDLLSPYVGVAERQVAQAFQDMRGGILLIDEVDSLLYSRDTAFRSWENSLVNEFLTSLEECCGFCICTTNRLQNIDAAALRRFSFKVPFGYAKPGQLGALYRSILAPLSTARLTKGEKGRLLALSELTPGDFNVVRSQYRLMNPEEVTHGQLIDALAAEQFAKQNHQGRRVGF